MHQQKEDTNSYPTTLIHPTYFYETNVAKLLHQPIVIDFNTSIGQ
jgi:hypothetical protein